MRYKIDSTPNEPLATLSTRGDLSATGLIEMLADLLGDPRWEPGMNILVDHRDSSVEHIPLNELDQVSQWVVAHNDQFGSRRCAIIAPEGEMTKISMWVVLTKPAIDIDLKMFQSAGAGRAWLDRSGGDV
jgi:hypothetical protein